MEVGDEGMNGKKMGKILWKMRVKGKKQDREAQVQHQER